MADTQTGFPKLNSEFVDENRQISIPWYRFLVSLWTRTGGSSGTISAVLDNIDDTPGAVLYRGATEWTGLAPGVAGQALTTEGPAAAPAWHNVVREVNTGAGLAGGPITGTGTISLAPVPSGTLFGNVSAGAAPPTPLLPPAVKTLLGYVASGDAAGGALGGVYPNPSLADAPASTMLGNNAAGAAPSVPLTVAQIQAMLGYLSSGSAAGGDLTGTYPSPTIGANKVTNAKLAQMSALTFKGNATGGTANAADLTVAQALSMLGLGAGAGQPNFLAYLSANQAVTSGVAAKILFDTAEFNVGAGYSTGTHQFLPTIAGTYEVSAALVGYDSGVTTVSIFVMKNGAYHGQIVTKPTELASAAISMLVQMNGTTDYLEIFGRVDSSGGAPVFLGGAAPFSTWFQAHRIGP